MGKVFLHITAFILLIFMSLPTALKWAHVSQHDNRECNEGISLHFHTAEFDCEFQEFKSTVYLYTLPISWETVVTATLTILPVSLYIPSDYTSPVGFSLRAPPIGIN